MIFEVCNTEDVFKKTFKLTLDLNLFLLFHPFEMIRVICSDFVL